MPRHVWDINEHAREGREGGGSKVVEIVIECVHGIYVKDFGLYISASHALDRTS